MSEERISLPEAWELVKKMEEECHAAADETESPREFLRLHRRAEALGLVREMYGE